MSTIALQALVSLAVMSFMFLVYLKTRNPAVVDLGWVAGLVLAAWIHLDTQSVAGLVIAGLALIWGLRLAGFLFWTRIRKGYKDPRYESIKTIQTDSKGLNYYLHYLIQALFQLVVAAAFMFAEPTIGLWWGIAIALVGIGLVGESVADYQLLLHRRLATGKVCRRGLWAYSRHPNYFFECVAWLGFALAGISGWASVLTLISPVVLYLTMAYITGPISETESVKSKPDDYRQYQATVPMIIPIRLPNKSFEKSN